MIYFLKQKPKSSIVIRLLAKHRECLKDITFHGLMSTILISSLVIRLLDGLCLFEDHLNHPSAVPILLSKGKIKRIVVGFHL